MFSFLNNSCSSSDKQVAVLSELDTLFTRSLKVSIHLEIFLLKEDFLKGENTLFFNFLVA